MKRIVYLIVLNGILILIDLILYILNITSEGFNYMYALGVSSGITFVVMLMSIFYLILWKRNTVKRHFDERQLKSRGDCFSISFFVLIVGLLLDGLIRLWFSFEWAGYFVGTFTWIMVAIGTFAILAIWKDAYTSDEKDRMKFGIFLFVAGLFDFIIGLVLGIRDGFIVNKQMDLPFINLFGGIILLITVINMFIKIKIDGKENFKDEELETEVC